MKYFKVFNTSQEYYNYIASDDFISPNVSTLRDSSNTWINPDEHEVIHVTSVTISSTAETITKGGTYTLTATVLPNNATDKSVTWTSSDDTIATVDSNGVVSGVASGDAFITVTTVDGGYTAQCSVSVSEEHDYSKDYFTIESLETSNEIKIQKVSGTNFTIQYSLDNGVSWNNVTNTSAGATIATLNIGEKVILKGNVTTYATAYNKYNHFIGSKSFKVYGNVMSLINGDNFTTNSEFSTSTTFNLCGLFYDSTNLIDAYNLVLPASSCTDSCYNGMFRGCTNLSVGPSILPATQAEHDCYSSMFEGCINLETAPEISLTNMAQTCCMRMFCMNRNSMIMTPKMTKSPILSCKTTVIDCYKEMFKGNGNLAEVTCLKEDDINACTDWLTNCSSTGIFYKSSLKNNWPRTTGGIPSGWTVENYTE